MKAIVCTKYGGPEVLELQEVAKPSPRPNEVLIKIHAATVTAAGLIGRKGEPYFTRVFTGFSKPKNDILGMELAGEVEAIGKDVKSLKVGDQVFGLTTKNLGANAEYICLPDDSTVIQKPTNLNYEESAAIVEGGLTALNFLNSTIQITPGQKVLINGASGSVGTASVQLAKHLGAEVTAVCSNSNIELVKSLGADEVIDYTKEDFTKNGQLYDVIFDTVGKRSFPQCKNALKPGGIFLDAANVATVFHMVWTSMFGKRKAILSASYLKPAKQIRANLILLKELAEAGAIRPVIDRRYALEQTAEAHEYVETGRKKGNVVINVVC